MIRSAVTISLVNEARGGPFVFWDDLPAGLRKAKALGFDGVEVFAPGPAAVNLAELRTLLNDHGLVLAAVGTGAGWVKHRLHLCLPDGAARGRPALSSVRSSTSAARSAPRPSSAPCKAATAMAWMRRPQ